MWFRSSIHSWRSSTSHRSKPKSSRSGQRLRTLTRRISLEPLEDRRLLSFSPATTYATGYGPRAIDTGDFNGDGDIDIAAVESYSLGMLLNNGDGTFQDLTQLSLDGQTGCDIVVGDVNADGSLDMAVSTLTSRQIGTGTDIYGNSYPIFGPVGHLRVLLGNGDGSFTPVEDHNLGDGGFDALALGDLNNDGYPDAAINDRGGTTMSVLLGHGDGTFGEPERLQVGSSPQQVDIADFNDDDKLDLVTTNLYGNAKVLLGNGNGTFQAAQVVVSGGPGALGQAVGDVNEDGKLDLAISSFNSSSYGGPYGSYESTFDVKVMVLLGRGDGTFSPGNGYLVDETERFERIELADLDGDGTIDVATGSYTTGKVTVLHGNGDGTFSDPRHFTSTGWNGGPSDLIVADLNGDAAVDIGAANYGANTISVFLNNGVSPPSISIGDASVVEGHVGTRTAEFTVNLSWPSEQPITVAYTTADRTAVANTDYQSAAGTLSFAPGETSKAVSVLVKGDRTAESDETFFVTLSSESGATLIDPQAVGTIADDDPWISIDDVAMQEGQSGNTAFVFTVSLSQFTDAPVTVEYATASGNASSSDFRPASGMLTFASSQTVKTVTVQVKGDTVSEANEHFYVNLSSPSGGSIADAQGIGTIVDDDSQPRLRIGDVSKNEGASGKASFVFTISLSAASSVPVTVNYATANGTAKTGDNDYDAKNGKITFAPGETTKTVTVIVRGDKKKEAHETFFVNLSKAKGALLDDAQGMGTITDDDSISRNFNRLPFAAALEEAMSDFLDMRHRRRHR